MNLSRVDTGGLGARLRSKPSIGAEIVDVLADESEVAELEEEVVEGQRTWRKVEARTGKQGWIDARLLRAASGGD